MRRRQYIYIQTPSDDAVMWGVETTTDIVQTLDLIPLTILALPQTETLPTVLSSSMNELLLRTPLTRTPTTNARVFHSANIHREKARVQSRVSAAHSCIPGF